MLAIVFALALRQLAKYEKVSGNQPLTEVKRKGARIDQHPNAVTIGWKTLAQ
jgi:hypothetical protein